MFQSRVRVFVLSDGSDVINKVLEIIGFNLAFEFSFCLTVFDYHPKGYRNFGFNLAFEFSFCLTIVLVRVRMVGSWFQSRVRVFVLSDRAGHTWGAARSRFQSRVRVFVLSDIAEEELKTYGGCFNLAFEFSFCLTSAIEWWGVLIQGFNLAFEFSFCLTKPEVSR